MVLFKIPDDHPEFARYRECFIAGMTQAFISMLESVGKSADGSEEPTQADEEWMEDFSREMKQFAFDILASGMSAFGSTTEGKS